MMSLAEPCAKASRKTEEEGGETLLRAVTEILHEERGRVGRAADNSLWAVHRGGKALAKLEGGLHLGGFCQPDTGERGQLGKPGPSNAWKPRKVAQEPFRETHRGLAARADTQDDGKQFGVRKRPGAILLQALARSLSYGKVSDDEVAFRHVSTPVERPGAHNSPPGKQ